MKPMTMRLLATTAFLMIAAGVLAQSEHESHHPGTEIAPAAPAPPAQPQTPEAQKDGMGMMSGNEMPMMMQMMQQMHGMMTGGGMTMQPKGDTGPSSQAFNGIIAKMHEGMTLPFSGNTDVDFAKRMVAHHQGAIDMAKVELAFGKDADTKKVAEEIIKTNEADIATLQDWLKKQGG